ncbi:protein of unknown function [Burkholderia multivorans]
MSAPPPRPSRSPRRKRGTDGRIVGASPSWHQFNLQTSYALSKRSDVYLQGEYQKVHSGGLNIGANINGLGTASSNDKQVSVTGRLRHRF